MPKFNDGQGRLNDSIPSKGKTGAEFNSNAPAAGALEFGRAGFFSKSGALAVATSTAGQAIGLLLTLTKAA